MTLPAILDAVPADGYGPVGKSLLRAAIMTRTAYVMADGDDLSTVACVDPVTGAAYADVILHGRVYHYDSSDDTTAPGSTVLVDSTGRRYKLAAGTDIVCFSVLDNSLSAPPALPARGAAYLIAAGATGAWAGHTDDVAIYTSRGWEFVTFGIGRLIYVETLEAYFHRNSSGAWVAGLGNLTIGANSVPLSAAINFGKILIVENQTTTAPPASPSPGTAYVIGPSATGAWSGKDGKIALCEVAGTFTIYNPTDGWHVYDKDEKSDFRFEGTAWVSALGAVLGYDYVFTATGNTTGTNGSSYTRSSTVAPTTSNSNVKDNGVLVYAARKAGAILRFSYFVQGAGDFDNNSSTFALFRDNEATALAWYTVPDLGQSWTLSFKFVIQTGDDAPHTYSIRQIMSATTASPSGSLDRRLFEVEEMNPS